MSLLRRLIEAWGRHKERGARSRKIREPMYERQPSLIFGGTAAGQFRDTYGWREIVPWQPIDEATRALDGWLNSHGLSRAQATDKMRREVRGDNGGEMRVLASPELLRH